MPVTPFHFGPALLVKGLTPRWFSFTTFVASQVVIDVETLFWLVRGQWPVHRVLHTFVGGALVGTAVAVAVNFLARRLARRKSGANASLWTEFRLGPALVGGLVGGLSHSLLDGIMHWDIQPFRPLTTENPLLGLLSLPYLHLLCVTTGLLGLVIVLARLPRRPRPT